MENKKDNKGIIGLLLLGFGVYYLLKNKKNTPQSMPTSIVPTGTQLTGETNIMPTQNNQSVQTSTPSIMQTISDITTAPIIVPNYQSSVYPSVPAPSGYTYATPATGGEQYLQTTGPLVPATPETISAQTPDWFTQYTPPMETIIPTPDFQTPATPETISAQTPDWFVQDTTGGGMTNDANNFFSFDYNTLNNNNSADIQAEK